MLATVLSLFAALLLVVGVLIVFRQGGPTRALTRAQAVRVLEDVLAGRARDADWLVFMAMPLRDDPVLVELRLRCRDVEEHWFAGEGPHRAPFLFRAEGLARLEQELRWLRRQSDERLL